MIFILSLLPFLSIQQTELFSFFMDNSFVSSNGTYINEIDWIVNGASNVFSDCGTERLFGGYGAFGEKAQAMIFLQLPPHYSIQIALDFWKIDSWNSEKFFIYVDQEQAYEQIFSTQGSQICRGVSHDLKTNIVLNIVHNFPIAFILITSNLDANPTNESWGFRNFVLSVFACPAGCITCISSDNRIQCIFWILYEQNLIQTIMNQFEFEGWIIDSDYSIATNCYAVPLFGGYPYNGKNSYIEKTVKLPPHSRVKVQFRYVFIDTWNNEFAFLYLDNTLVWSYQYEYNSRKIQDLCGEPYDEILFVNEVEISHSSSTLTIRFSSDLDQVATNESFGVRDIFVYIPCLFGNSYDQTCGQVCGNGVIEGFEVCDDGNLDPFDGCFSCQYSCVEGCSQCHEGICLGCYYEWNYQLEDNSCISESQNGIVTNKEICDDLAQFQRCYNGKFQCPNDCKLCSYGICEECESNFFLIDNSCQYICQNLSFPHIKQCDDYNIDPFDSCHQCQDNNLEGCLIMNRSKCITCDTGWSLDFKIGKCFPKCGDYQILGGEECDIEKYSLSKKPYGCEKCKFNCQEQCTDCKFGKCYQCAKGWIVQKYKCQPFCGDYEVVKSEECDDINKIRLSGCYNCKNDCQTQCIECVNGQCFKCIYGWNLNENFLCEKKCGDNLVALISNEECDDDNQGQNDGCFKCKTECCDYCSACIYGICFDCQYTFTLIDEYCLPVCGDGLISVGFEQCDDMNDIPYDGCYNCNYQCRKHCKLCIKGVCYDRCDYGFYETENYQCITVCGDGIVAGFEDCEDTNDFLFHICSDCSYICPEHCLMCEEGICKKCDQGYELFPNLNMCRSFCGNGIVSDIEECDDENKNDGDGCSKLCKIETNYLCKNFQFSFSQCTYEKYPLFKVEYIRQDFEKQYVLLKFTQQVKSLSKDSQYSNRITLNIIEMNKEEYNISMMIIQDVQDFVSEVEYLVEIIINQSLSEAPHLEVTLPEILYNINDAPLTNLKQLAKLQKPQYMDDQKQQTAVMLQKMNSYVINSMGGLGFFFLLIGNSVVFSSLLEILQQQSYLRFINVVFPLNLFIYFESSNQITIEPIINVVKFEAITSRFLESQYSESYEKLLFYEINSDLYSNLQAQFTLLLLIIFIYTVCIFFLTIFIKFKQHQYLWVGDFFFKYLWKISKVSLKCKQEFEKKGFKTFYIANNWDLLFMCLLQLKSMQPPDLRYQISYFISFIFLLFFIIQISNYCNVATLVKKSKFQQCQEKLELSTQLKKILFISILILFQKNQQIQSILLTLICNFYLLTIFQYDTFQNRQDSFNFRLNEISVWFFSITTAFYWNIAYNYFNYDQQVQLGWFHIGIFLFALLVNLIFQLTRMIIEAKKKFDYYVQKQSNNKLNNQNFNIIPISNIMEYKF